MTYRPRALLSAVHFFVRVATRQEGQPQARRPLPHFFLLVSQFAGHLTEKDQLLVLNLYVSPLFSIDATQGLANIVHGLTGPGPGRALKKNPQNHDANDVQQ